MRHRNGRLMVAALLLPLTLFACTAAPPPEPEERGGPPVGSRVVFTGDFETGDFSQWTRCQNRAFSAPCEEYDGDFYGARIVDDEVSQGEFAARFEVRNGDDPSWGGGERSEVSRYDGAKVHEGDERWYQFSLKFDEDFPDIKGNFFIVMQWHAGKGSPPMALTVNHDRELVLANNVHDGQNRVIGEIQRGEWVDYVVHVKFSQSKDRGWAEVYQDGELVVPRHARASMSSDSNYLKMGIYRASIERSTAIIWQDGLQVTAP